MTGVGHDFNHSLCPPTPLTHINEEVELLVHIWILQIKSMYDKSQERKLTFTFPQSQSQPVLTTHVTSHSHKSQLLIFSQLTMQFEMVMASFHIDIFTTHESRVNWRRHTFIKILSFSLPTTFSTSIIISYPNHEYMPRYVGIFCGFGHLLVRCYYLCNAEAILAVVLDHFFVAVEIQKFVSGAEEDSPLLSVIQDNGGDDAH